ncbi:nuclear transport factor 2 family protein [Altererythrobacter endophyticus]|uniref:Nuclear transport factor 2 family protein n=1 Tax=Altericroceibacterium endophyticum TaxID=1808508 RepID=A0A6I4T9K6_9SPHN|nr:nuclear transport factor 2 family protein [Altericroceibacterium endophyticum]MXO67089.1 nuclear transport factor 2 family protein [Altericroceibacterium endophyticum]
MSLSVLLIGAPAQAEPPASAELAALDRDVSRTQSLRAVKDLQRFYAQYAQFALWPEMADLFSQDATLIWGETTVHGRGEIAEWLKNRLGGTRGLSDGALRAPFIEDPLVNLSIDGKSAKGRWLGLIMAGDGSGETSIEGGIFENEFVLDNGVWKFSKLHFYPQYEGDYETGWSNAGGQELPQIPYHFTLDETGIPIPPAPPSPALAEASLDVLEDRIAALNAEDAVRNLQNAYGYYVDRKMWDDVVDLFARDAQVEIAGAGQFDGRGGIRKAMERMGDQTLQHGEFNDHPLFDTIITVSPGAREAYARGIELGMTGTADNGEAAWQFSVFRNRFVLEDGLWKIREMRLYPLLRADYAVGWGHGGSAHLTQILPAFTEPHPVTGKGVTIDGFTLSGTDDLTAPDVTDTTEESRPALSFEKRLYEARRKLARAQAYDGVVNVSSAYGYYLDDFQWVNMASLFAEEGNKHSPFAGFYIGRDRIMAAATAMYGDPPPTRPGISFHWRFQPVIHVSHDGRSANLRTRLFQPRTTMPRKAGDPAPSGIYSGALFSGMYPNDQAVLEDGIWRLWSLTIDEPYMTTDSWAGGWSAVAPTPPGQGGGQSPLVERLPPDILMTDLGKRAEHFRGGTGETLAWPAILPMWFHYKNPVSGRVPEFYSPDSVPSLLRPESRLIAHGYQMPPNGPEQDGIHIELTPPEVARDVEPGK